MPDVASEWTRYAESEKAARQRDAALHHANDVRVARAQLKRDMKAGRVRLADVLLEPPACTARMTLVDLLLAAPKVGRARAAGLLTAAQVSPSRPVGRLTVRQRRLLAALLIGDSGAMLRRVPDVEAMTMGKVLVTWRDEEENGVQVGVFDVPADVDGDDLDREVQGLMGVWDTVAVVDRCALREAVT